MSSLRWLGKDLEGDGQVLSEGRPTIPEFASGNRNTVGLIRKEYFSNTVLVNYLIGNIERSPYADLQMKTSVAVSWKPSYFVT
jgi:hypothetical protein